MLVRLGLRLLVLFTLVLGAVMLQPKPAFACDRGCRLQCIDQERNCEDFCPGCDCLGDYQACVQACGC